MQKINQRPTAKEVAKRCGVSVATVSRVLNGNFKNGFSVRKELLEQITQIANELGYRPNIAARNLAQQQTHIISFLGCNTSFGWPTNIYQLSCETAIRHLQHYGYNICTTAPNLDRDKTELPPWRVDGVIVIQECSQETIEQMEQTNLPYVVINGEAGASGSSVVLDDVDATQRAVKHLVELGHRRIAYAGQTPNHRHHMSIKERHQTYLSELEKHGLEPIKGHGEIVDTALDFLVLAVLKEKATAIIAYDHYVAMQIIHDANTLNIKIPQQVSLICFNDESICDLIVPPLTTVGVPSAEMGQVAAELLLKQMQSPNKKQPECIKLHEDLIVRASTVQPAS